MILKNLTKNFTTVPNELITNVSISAGAFRLYCYLASKPETWEVYNNDIMKQLKISDKTLSKFFKELIGGGWLERKKITPNEAKKLNLKAGSYIYYLNSSKSEKTSEKETYSKKEKNGVSKSEKTSEKEKTSAYSNTKYNISNTEINNKTLSEIINSFLKKLSTKTDINLLRQRSKYEKVIFSLSKYYSLKEIEEALNYALEEEKYLSTISNPSFLNNSFENIKLAKDKEKRESSKEMLCL